MFMNNGEEASQSVPWVGLVKQNHSIKKKFQVQCLVHHVYMENELLSAPKGSYVRHALCLLLLSAPVPIACSSGMSRTDGYCNV